VAALFDYFKHITYYLLFASLAGMAVAGRYRKYLALVTGIILLVLLLQPLRGLLGSGIPVTEIFAGLAPAPSTPAFAPGSGGGSSEPYEAWRYETLREAFEEQLTVQLAALLSGKGYTLREASFGYAEDFSVIEYASVKIADPAAAENRPFIYIEPVRVSVFERETNAGQENPEIAALKKLISDFYNLNGEHIHVEITNHTG
jgi:hypothetical protein